MGAFEGWPSYAGPVEAREPSMKYTVSQRALETIERECRRSPEAETGGILVGFRENAQTIITHATGPGPKAVRSPHHFVKDTPYLQTVLELLFQYYQVNYLGVWHKHPRAMPYPSSGDIAAAMDEIAGGETGLDALLTPICVMESGRVEVIPYVIKDNSPARAVWDAVPHDELPSEQSVTAQWYTTPAGQSRLAEEMSRFEAAGVSVEVRKGSVRREGGSGGPARRGGGLLGNDPLGSIIGRRGSEPRVPDGEVFIDVTLDREQAYVGEQVLLTYRIYTQPALASLPQPSELPSLTGFWVEEIPVDPRATLRKRVIRGKEYTEIVLMKKALFPTKSGNLSIEETVFQVPVRAAGNDPLDRFLNASRIIYRRSMCSWNRLSRAGKS